MSLVSTVIDYAAPIFLITSPLTSYTDQIYSIHRTRTSGGFSLDIPLIMLVASVLKVFYWFGAYYSSTLLMQSIVMILVQLVLLKIALDNRPSPGMKNGVEHAPFSSVEIGSSRPYDFWQWKNSKPYWLFLAYFVAAFLCIHLTPVGRTETYISILGFTGLAVEATLPIPQIIKNQQSRSCTGFRVSVLAAWIIGDAMKMGYFFCSTEVIPLAFRVCGVFQCLCDCYLGIQFWMFSRNSYSVSSSPRENGHGHRHRHSHSDQDGWEHGEKDIRMS